MHFARWSLLPLCLCASALSLLRLIAAPCTFSNSSKRHVRPPPQHLGEFVLFRMQRGYFRKPWNKCKKHINVSDLSNGGTSPRASKIDTWDHPARLLTFSVRPPQQALYVPMPSFTLALDFSFLSHPSALFLHPSPCLLFVLRAAGTAVLPFVTPTGSSGEDRPSDPTTGKGAREWEEGRVTEGRDGSREM